MLTFADLIGSSPCSEALITGWSFDHTDACNPVLLATYSWQDIIAQCPADLRVTNTTTGFITWLIPELTYTELIQVADGGKKREVRPRSTISRDYTAEYPFRRTLKRV